ncbi:MAG: hypothetical protein PHR06_16235, partial [Candidatus Cloacimonetes bacterium]|nr:hypothetical protein [Candidatus Cloacimonadota bacterium]
MNQMNCRAIILLSLFSIVLLPLVSAIETDVQSPLTIQSPFAGMDIRTMLPDIIQPSLSQRALPVQSIPAEKDITFADNNGDIGMVRDTKILPTSDLKGERTWTVQPGPVTGKDTSVWEYFP